MGVTRADVWTIGLLLSAPLSITAMGALPLQAQEPSRPVLSDSVVIVAGAHYRAGGLYRAIMGAGHRDLWTTPIKVPVADLSSLGGGLTAVRVGGGTTTQTLHLDGGDGRRYVLRSVDKVPVDLIAEFVGTPVEAILRDQMSSFHPSGAVVVASLLEAVGVLHASPRLVVVPDDPRLGEFRDQFAGMLALFEERPDDPGDGGAGFAGSTEVVQTDRIFEILEEDPRQRIETTELLKSRLIDLLVGDRDRSTNNHLWARFDDGSGGYRWRPVPRDRDQAFVQLDGFLKGLARNYEPRLVPFGPEYPSVEGLSRNAWDIDRNFLVGVSRSEWLAIVQDVQRLITDQVIGQAVREMPAEHFAIAGADLAHALRTRRDDLPDAAEKLYEIVFKYADVHGTDVDEVGVVERLEDGSLRVTIDATSADGSALGTTFQRTFSPSETTEVRLYLHGGADRVTVQGGGPGFIKLRVVGGGGPDRLTDASSTLEGQNVFYDAGDATVISEGPATRFHDRGAPRPYSWFEESRTLDWGHSWIAEPRIAYDEDRGPVVVAGLTLTRYGFLKVPYASEMRFRVGCIRSPTEPTT